MQPQIKACDCVRARSDSRQTHAHRHPNAPLLRMQDREGEVTGFQACMSGFTYDRVARIVKVK